MLLHVLAEVRFPSLGTFKAVGVRLKVHEGLHNLVLGVEDKGTILNDGLIQRRAGHQDETGVLGGVGVGLEVDGVALHVEDGIVILSHNLPIAIPFLADNGAPLENVGKRVPPLRQRLHHLGARPEGDVEDPDGRVGEVLDRVHAVALSGDDLYGRPAAVDVHGGDLGGAEVAVARVAVLEGLGQVDPELEADVGAPVGVGARHLGVLDALAGGHELEVSGVDCAAGACEVFMVDGALEEICDGFLAAMGAFLNNVSLCVFKNSNNNSKTY